MEVVGKIDIEKYKGISADILTDEVVLTEKQVKHINERRKGVLDKYFGLFANVLIDPDIIFQDSKNESTALVCKRMSGTDEKSLFIVLKLAVSGDDPAHKNSIITAHELDGAKYRQYLRTKKIVYKNV